MATVFSGVVVAKVKGVTCVMLRLESIQQGSEIQCISDALEELVEERGVEKLIVDFRAVEYFCSQMLSVLIDLNRDIQAVNGRLVLLGVHPRLQELFRITGIEKFFTFAPTEELALLLLNSE
ncbi:MAG: STAS domain-containing protein [Phycisphaerae bacterium]|nr:STAS domain-containing protein [Phycisphaerae bacterium]